MKKVLFILFFVLLFCPFFVLAADNVEINTSSLQQLETLTGIGPVKAQAIIDARPYSSIDDLLRVSGIGEKTLQKIKDQGLAYVGENPNDQIPISNENQNPALTQTPDVNGTPTSGVDATPVYPGGVFINEILPNPEGADETDEWIELYNSNSFDVDLSGWQIQDTEGTITTYTINPSARSSTEALSKSSGQAKILADGFLVFKRPDTKIMLNNDKDGINLLTPDKKIVDSVTFTSAPLGQSYNKIPSDLSAQVGWQWSLTLTPGAKNIIPIAATKTPSTGSSTEAHSKSSGPNGLSKAENSVKNNYDGAGLADLSQSINTNQNSMTKSPWFLFFTVLAITIILSTIVLLVKLRFRARSSE